MRPDGEVARVRVPEVDAADARGREVIAHDSVSSIPDVLCAEEVEELALLRVVGAGGVAERRADAAEALRDQMSSLDSCVPVSYHSRRATLVQVLGERLGKAVGESLGHDRAVVVVLGLEAGRELVERRCRR